MTGTGNGPPSYVGYIAMSLDGFIADREGGVDWLEAFNVAGNDHGYAEFIAGIDAVLMGRASYDQVMGWGWPYGDRPGYVLTRETGFAGPHVAAAGDMAVLDNAIREAGHARIWILGGGEAQRAALDAGMFHSLRVFVMPLILGGGHPLFAPGLSCKLHLRGSATHSSGAVQIDYAIARPV